MAAQIAAGMAAAGVQQMLNERAASQSYEREKKLMGMQNAMNLGNMVTAPGKEIEGLRMAGFNPAMVAGAGTQAAPAVTKGSSDMAQTVDLSQIAQLGLMEAQKENIEANTEKTKAETQISKWDQPKNVQANTANQEAAANHNVVDAQRIQNINDAFADENEAIAGFGQTMAQKWQKTEWYKALSPDTKETINSIADGTLPMTIGGMTALSKVIEAQKGLSDADRRMVDNAFANVITEAMWKEPKVIEALKMLPVTQQNEAQSRTVKNIVETGILRIDKANKEDQRNVYLHQDPDKLYLEYQKEPNLENLIKWLSATVNDKLDKGYEASVHGVGPAAGGYLAGKGMQKATETAKKGSGHTKTVKYPDHVDPPILDASGKRIKGTGATSSWTEYKSEDEGVQQMFNRR